MARVSYVGDEVSAAGYRLAGAQVQAPAPGEELACIERARGASDLVLVGAACAARLASDALGLLLRHETPFVLVVPDDGPEQADIGARLRRQLGL